MRAFNTESDIKYRVKFAGSERDKMGLGWYAALTRAEISRTFIARFPTKYQIQDNGCWLWSGGCVPGGYGQCNLGRFADGRQHTEYAHRVSHVIYNGNIPDGFLVMHSCDTPACVNPAHLSLGTQLINLQDAEAKGRMNRGGGRRRRKVA